MKVPCIIFTHENQNSLKTLLRYFIAVMSYAMIHKEKSSHKEERARFDF